MDLLSPESEKLHSTYTIDIWYNDLSKKSKMCTHSHSILFISNLMTNYTFQNIMNLSSFSSNICLSLFVRETLELFQKKEKINFFLKFCYSFLINQWKVLQSFLLLLSIPGQTTMNFLCPELFQWVWKRFTLYKITRNIYLVAVDCSLKTAFWTSLELISDH